MYQIICPVLERLCVVGGGDASDGAGTGAEIDEVRGGVCADHGAAVEPDRGGGGAGGVGADLPALARSLRGGRGGGSGQRVLANWPACLSHGINATRMGVTPEYRAAIAKAVDGRSVAGSAISSGLPRDAIRSVLQGHDPTLARADAICRALGITFTIGTPSDPGQAGQRSSDPTPAASNTGATPPEPASFDANSIDDERLARLLVRLTNLWKTCDANERRHVTVVVAAVLDLAGMIRKPAPKDALPEPE